MRKRNKVKDRDETKKANWITAITQETGRAGQRSAKDATKTTCESCAQPKSAVFSSGLPPKRWNRRTNVFLICLIRKFSRSHSFCRLTVGIYNLLVAGWSFLVTWVPNLSFKEVRLQRTANEHYFLCESFLFWRRPNISYKWSKTIKQLCL